MSIRLPLALAALSLLAACGGGGGGPTPGVVSTSLAAPANLRVGDDPRRPRQVTLTWDPPQESVDGYVVEMQQGTGTFAPITPSPIKPNYLLYTFDPSAPEATDFGFRVCGVKGSSHTDYTPVHTYHLGVNPPSQPTATYDIDAGGVRLAWTRSTLIGDGVRVERATCDFYGTDTGPWESLPALGPAAVSALDLNAPTTTWVHYRVINLKGTEESAPSPVSTPLIPGFPGPARFYLSSGNGQITLTWSSTSQPIDGIQIERCQTDSSGSPLNAWSVVATLGPSDTTWVDGNWVEMAYNEYRITFLHGSVLSTSTTSIPIYMQFRPPSDLQISQVSGGLHLSWKNHSQIATEIQIVRFAGNQSGLGTTISTLGVTTTSYDDFAIPQLGYYGYQVCAAANGARSGSPIVLAAPADPPGALILSPTSIALPTSAGLDSAALRPDGTWMVWTRPDGLLSLAQPWPAYRPQGYTGYPADLHLESDALGNPHLLFLLQDPGDSSLWDLTHDWFDGTSWKRETLGTLNGNQFSAALDGGGSPLALGSILVNGSGSQLALLHKVNGIWTESTLSDLGISNPGYTETYALSVDPLGKPHLLLSSYGDLHEADEDVNGTWIDTVMAPSSIAGPVQGNWKDSSTAQVLAKDSGNNYRIYEKTGGAWQSSGTVTTDSSSSAYPWVGHSADGTHFAMYLNTFVGIKIFHRDDQGAWHQTLVRVPPGPYGIRLGFDATNKLHLLVTSSAGGATDFHE